MLRNQIERMEYLALQDLVIARNKLINDLLEEIPETDKAFRKGLEMRNKAWEKDKEIWAKARKQRDEEFTECQETK